MEAIGKERRVSSSNFLGKRGWGPCKNCNGSLGRMGMSIGGCKEAARGKKICRG